MGVSTDGILFYGLIWDDEYDFESVPDTYDWPEVIAKQRGIPFEDYLPYDQRKPIEAEFGVNFGHHGSDGWSVPYIYVVESQTTAWRGSPQKIDKQFTHAACLDTTTKTFDWNAKLDNFIAALGLEDDVADLERAWWLCSWWG